jgi:hypothetical protein
MNSALYVLHYIHSTYNYGISFTSKHMAPMHSYILFPPSNNNEAYTNTIPPKLLMTRTLLAYSDACWGSKIGNAVTEGTLPPLFKFQSMNGDIIFKNGCPIEWLGKIKNARLSAPVRLKFGLPSNLEEGCQLPQPLLQCLQEWPRNRWPLLSNGTVQQQ